MSPSEMVMEILNDEDKLMPILFATVGIVWIVWGSVTSMVKATARERTRRDIAAYIAEGGMSPEQGEKLMKAGEKKCGW